MSDVRDDYEAMKEHKQHVKEQRRSENLAHLESHNVNWRWIDQLCDHILINNEIDYYLGKTFWFNRRTGQGGYTMLHKLLTGESGERAPCSK